MSAASSRAPRRPATGAHSGPATRERDVAADLTAPVEDYLKAIYELERETDAAATNDIANRLAIAPPSVSGMVRRLAEQGLLTYERYRGVRLTEAGRRAALRTIRRHRVIEAYLTRALGYPWDRVHEEAERLEHAASDELIDRMAAAIGEPDTDPHGAPIPTRDGTIVERRYASLAELSVGARARVARVGDESAEMLRYLAEIGLRPGAPITLAERAPFGGPLTIRVGKTSRLIGAELARVVMVEEA